MVTTNLTEGSRHCVLCVELLALRIVVVCEPEEDT